MSHEEKAHRLAAMINRYVPKGFRDEDGVWHEGLQWSQAIADLAVISGVDATKLMEVGRPAVPSQDSEQ